MLTFDDEDDILDDVKDAVSIALDELQLEDAYVDDIKLNKLAYLLIQEYNLNVTYGWYKYGAAPYHVDGQVQGQTAFVEAKAPQEIPASDSSRLPDEFGDYRSPVEWAYFYTNTIRDEFIDIVTSETKEYLVKFYDEYAPPDYENLYKESARLQQALDHIKEDPSWITEADYYYSEVKEGLFSVHQEMLLTSDVEEAVKPFSSYMNLLENVLLAAKQSEQLTEAQQEEVENIVNFFYGNAWEWVALLISKQTVRGDNSAVLKQSIDRDLNNLRNNYERELDRLQDKAKARGLWPEHMEELEALEDEDCVIPADKPNSEVVDAWTKAGAEVIMDDNSE
jgi:hypothetical protein